jgi:hypothetical protein
MLTPTPKMQAGWNGVGRVAHAAPRPALAAG